MADKITWADKESLVTDPTIAEINKVTDDNMNEIKSVTNTNADELAEKIVYDENDITENTSMIIEEVPEGSNIPYINSEISIGSTNEDNRPVWFKQSKNIFGAIPSTQTKNGITLTNNGDGTFNLVGTATAQTEFIWWKDFNDYKSSIKQNAKWSSYVNKSNSNVIYQLSTWNGTTASPVWASTPIQFTETQTDKTILASTYGSLLRFNIQINNGTSVNLTNIEVALEMTSEEISYNKYLGYSSININGNDEYYTNDYSAEEQVIGKWKDGKPLYRSVIEYTLSIDTTTYFGTYIGSADLIKSIDTLVDYRFYVYNGTLIFPIPNFGGTNNDRDCGIYIQRSYGGIGFQCFARSINNYNGKQAQIILEYTKTTD